jgi:vanillate O-demethylase monooxygenase subunit
VCGYHGLRYDTDGRCIEIPMQKTVPASMRVRAYTTAEKGPFVWVWMGRDAPGAAGPPHQSWLEEPEWAVRWGYLHVKGSYVHMHENLLDLSHLSFLHAKTFGTPEYARTPVEMNCEGDKLEVWRHVRQLPGIYANRSVGRVRADPQLGLHVSPGLHINTGIFRNLDLPTEAVASADGQGRAARDAETATTTHYWTAQARNFATHDAEMRRLHDQGADRGVQGRCLLRRANNRDAGARER